jgi:hypothetical protein
MLRGTKIQAPADARDKQIHVQRHSSRLMKQLGAWGEVEEYILALLS